MSGCELSPNFEKIKELSSGSTGSEANVSIYRNTTNNRLYIIKKTPLKGSLYQMEENQSTQTNIIKNTRTKIKNEANAYLLMGMLVNYKILPYVIMGSTPEKQNNNCDYIYQFNEAVDTNDFDLYTLEEFLNQILPQILPQILNDDLKSDIVYLIFLTIMFQLTYTFMIFNLIGLQHNDTHINNVFVLINKHRNIINHTTEVINNLDVFNFDFRNKFNNKSGGDMNNLNLISIFRLLDIGISTRIYDFDRSSKINSQYPINKLFNGIAFSNPNDDAYPTDSSKQLNIPNNRRKSKNNSKLQDITVLETYTLNRLQSL